MRLSDYLELNSISPEECAAAIGVHMVTVYRLCAGTNFPKADTIRKIAEWTKGEDGVPRVSANDFMDIPPPPAKPLGRPRRPESAEAAE